MDLGIALALNADARRRVAEFMLLRIRQMKAPAQVILAR